MEKGLLVVNINGSIRLIKQRVEELRAMEHTLGHETLMAFNDVLEALEYLEKVTE